MPFMRRKRPAAAVTLPQHESCVVGEVAGGRDTDVEAVGERATVMIDEGVRRGSDVLKALALGAKFVFVGRPFL